MLEGQLCRFNGKFISLSLLIFASFLFFVGNSFAQTLEQVKFYTERIEFGTEDVKRNALFDLRSFKTESASRIALPALKDSSEIIRATATHSVIYLTQEESATALLPLLNDKSEFVRREALYALGKTRNRTIVRDIIRVIEKEKKQSVKDSAAVALGYIGSPVAIPTLSNILLKKSKKKQNFFRRAAARSIGQIAESIKQKNLTFATPQNFLPSKYKNLEDSDFEGFISSFPVFQNAITILSRTLINSKETQDTRRESAFALGAIGNPSAIQILKDNLNSEDYYLAEICKEALLRIQN